MELCEPGSEPEYQLLGRYRRYKMAGLVSCKFKLYFWGMGRGDDTQLPIWSEPSDRDQMSEFSSHFATDVNISWRSRKLLREKSRRQSCDFLSRRRAHSVPPAAFSMNIPVVKDWTEQIVVPDRRVLSGQEGRSSRGRTCQFLLVMISTLNILTFSFFGQEAQLLINSGTLTCQFQHDMKTSVCVCVYDIQLSGSRDKQEN